MCTEVTLSASENRDANDSKKTIKNRNASSERSEDPSVRHERSKIKTRRSKAGI